MNEILVDEYGYQQFLDEIDRLEQLSLKNSSIGSEAYQDAVGDGWHDNFAFEESMRESRNIANRIDKMLKLKPFLKIIKPNVFNPEQINIGDILKLEIKYGSDDIEITTIKLTGNYFPNVNNCTIQEITLNSPLGKSLYLKNIKDNNLNYLVNDKKIEINIIERVKE